MSSSRWLFLIAAPKDDRDLTAPPAGGVGARPLHKPLAERGDEAGSRERKNCRAGPDRAADAASAPALRHRHSRPVAMSTMGW